MTVVRPQMESNMLPQGVIDGIINYVNSAVKQHIRTKDEEGRYVQHEPVVICTDNNLMIVFNYENRPLEQISSHEEE